MREGKLGNFLRMLADLNLASQVQPCNAAIFTERSVAKRLLNDFDGALGDLDAAHHLSPSFSSTLMTRGRLKYLMGDFHSALADLDAAHILNPNDDGKILRCVCSSSTFNSGHVTIKFSAHLVNIPSADWESWHFVA